MSRCLSLALACPALLLVTGCAPQPDGGARAEPRATTSSPAAAARNQLEAPRTDPGAPFNPLDTGGPASTGGGGY